MSWTKIVGKRFTLEEFERHVASVKMGASFRPRAVTLHHTWRPTLAEWNKGDWRDNLESLAHFYRDVRGWDSAPHLFIDQGFVYGFTPLNVRGVHAISFNDYAWGVEVVGDFGGYPGTGSPMGASQKSLVADTVAVLCQKGGFEPSLETFLFHRDDPKAHGKTCPGLLVRKDEMLALVKARVDSRNRPVVVNDQFHIPGMVLAGTTWVALRPFAEALGYGVVWEKGSVGVVRNGRRFFFLPGTFKNVAGVAYVPLDTLARKCRLEVSVTRGRIDVRPGG